MKFSKSTLFLCFSSMVALVLIPEVSNAARDLNSAASSATSQSKLIAGSLSTLGLFVGAIIYQIPGAVRFAQGAIVSGLIGMVLAFGGAEGLAGFLKRIFGG